MPRTVDERVVEMQFDNSKFEKNVKQSMSTMDKLKKAFSGVDDSAKSLQNLEKVGSKFDISHVGDSVDYIAKQFNILGRVGMKLKDDIANYVSSIIENVASLPKKLALDTISEGWTKYGDKASSVQTIMAATGKSVEEVEAQMKKLMWFTDETSYSFTDMSANIGKFTNAGVDLETATTAMMGISNWAARSGANVNEASRAMYNLSQALAVGQVKLIDWKSVENANMATVEFKQTAIDTAVALGTLREIGDGLYETMNGTVVSATNFNEALSEGWFNSDVLLKTLNLYGEYTEEVYKNRKEGELAADTMERIGDMGMTLGREAFLAAQEYRTAADVVNATTDAVSTKWMNLFQLFFGNAVEAKAVWAELGGAMYDIFAGPLDSLTDLLTPAMVNPVETFREALDQAEVDYNSFYKNLIKAGQARGVWNAYENYGGGADAFGAKEWATRVDIIRALNMELRATHVSTEAVDDSLQRLSDIADEVIDGAWGDGEERVRRLTEAGLDHLQVQDLVNKRLAGEEIILTDLSDAQLEHLGYTDEQIEKIRELIGALEEEDSELGKVVDRMNKPSGSELFFKSIQNVIQAGYNLAEVLGGAFRDIFPATTSERIYSIMEALQSFTSKLIMSEETMERVRRVLRGVFAAFDIAWQAIKAVAGGIKDVIKAILPSGDTVNSFLDFSGSISDMIVNFDKMIKESGLFKTAIAGVVEPIKAGIRVAKEWIRDVPRIFTEFIDKIKTAHPEWVKAWDNFKETAGDFFANFWENIKNAYSKFKDWIADIRSSNAGGAIYDSIKDGSSKAGEALLSMWEKIKEVWAVVKPYIDTLVSYIKDMLGETWDNLKSLFEKNDLGSIGSVLDAVFQGGIFLVIRDFFSHMKKSVGSFEGILGGIEKASRRFKDVVRSYSMDIKADALEKVAISIGILAGSMLVLSLIPADKLESASNALIKVMGALTIMSAVMSKWSFSTKSTSITKEGGVLGGLTSIFGDGKSATSLVKMAAAVLVLAKAVKTLSQLDEADLNRGMGAVIGLMGSLTVMMKLMPAENDVGKIGKAFKGLGTAFLLISVAFKIFDTIRPDTLELGIVALLATVGGLAGALALIGGLNIQESQIASFGAAILQLSAGMLLISGALKIAGSMGETAVTIALAAFGGALMIIVAAGVAIQKAGVADALMSLGFSAFTIGAGMALAGLGLILFSKALILLAKASAVAGVAAGALLVILGILLTGLVQWCNDNAGAIADVFVLLVKEGVRGLSEAAYELCLELVGPLVQILELLADNAAPIVDACVRILIGLLEGLAEHMPELVGAIAKVVAAIFGAIAESLNGLSGAKMIALIGGIEAMALITKQLANLKKDIGSALLAGGGMVLIFGAVAGVFYLIKDVDGVNMLAQATSISEAMLAMALVVNLLKDIDTTEALNAIKSLDIMFGNLALVIGGLAVLDFAGNAIFGDDSVEQFIQGGLDRLTQICTGVGEAIGGLVGGVLEGILESLPGIGTSLSDFGTNVSPFMDMVKGVDPTTAEGAEALANVVLKLTESAFIDGLGRLLGFDMDPDKLSTSLVGFGQAMVAFHKETAGLKGEDVEGAAKAGTILADLSKAMPKTGGWYQQIMGEDMNMKIYGERLVAFGEAMVEFAKKTAGLNEDDVTGSVNAGKALAGLADAMPKTGGWYQKIMGEVPDMQEFGADLCDFATAMVEYGKIAVDIDTLAIRKSASAFDALLNTTNTADMTASGQWGILSAGGVLREFGQAYLDYYTNISGFEDSKLDAASKHLSEIIESATSSSSASDIQALATTLDTISSFSVDSMVGSFENAAPRMYEAGRNAIQQFTQGVGSSSLSEMDILMAASDTVGTFEEYVNGYSTNFHDSGANLMSDFLSGIKTAWVVMKTWLSTNILSKEEGGEGIISRFATAFKDFKQVGTDAFGEFLDGMIEEAQPIWDSTTALIEGVISKLRDGYQDAYKAGKYIVDGFVSGVDDNNYRAGNAARRLANKVISMTKAELDEHSPSKKFKTIGKNVVLGFAQGIGISENVAKKAVTKAFSKNISDVMSKFMQNFKKTMKQQGVENTTQAATEAITKFVEELYKQTDAYKESKKKIKEYRKEIEKLQNKLNETTDSSKRKELEKEIEDLEKKISDEQKQMVKDMEETFNEYLDSVKDSVKSYLNFLDVEGDTGIDFFSEFASNINDDIASALDILNAGVEDVADNGILSYLDAVGNQLTGDNSNSISSSLDVLNAQLSGDTNSLESSLDILKAKVDGNSDDSLVSAVSVLNDEFEETEDIIAGQDGIISALDMMKVETNSYIDTFQAFTKESGLGISTILNRMESQVKGVRNWMNGLDKLATRGIDEGLMQKLRDMGPQGAAYIEAFLKMTSAEIERANKAFSNQKLIDSETLLGNMRDQIKSTKAWAMNLQKLAARGLSQGLLKEFAELGPESAEKVQALVNMTDAQFKEYVKIYEEAADAVEDITNRISESTNSAIQNGASASQTILDDLESQIDDVEDWTRNLEKLYERGISGGLLKELSDLGPEGAGKVKAFVNMSDEEFSRLNKVYERSVESASEMTTKISEMLSGYTQEVSTREALDAMGQQSRDVEHWVTNLEGLVDKGIDQGFLKKLVDAGVEGADKVAMYAKMDQSQFDELMRRYAESVDLADTLAGRLANLTSEYDTQKTIGDTLKAMKQQIKDVENWADNMETLAHRGISDGLLKELADAGPESAEKVAMLVKMSGEQLARFDELYAKSADSASKVTERVSKLTSAYEKKIAGDNMLNSLKTKIQNVEDWTNNMGKLAERGLDEGILKQLAELGPEGAEDVATLVNMSDAQFKKYHKLLKQSADVAQNSISKISALTSEYDRTIAATTMLDSMKQQTEGVRKWASDLKKLAKRGLEDGLLKELAAAGPSSADQVALMVQLQDKEFKKLNNLYKDAQTATAEISSQVSKLTEEYDRKLAASTFVDNMKAQVDAYKDYAKDIKNLRKTGLSEGLLAEVEALGMEGAETVKTFLAMSKKQINEANAQYSEKIKESNKLLIENTKKKLQDVKKWSDTLAALAGRGANKYIMQQLVEAGPDSLEMAMAYLSMEDKDLKKLNKLYKQAYTIPDDIAEDVISSYIYAGSAATQGFAQGLLNESTQANAAATQMAMTALNAAKSALGIQSPSKEFASIGRYAVLGFTNALKLYGVSSYDAALSMGDYASEGLTDAITQILALVDEELDPALTITPVIDLSKVDEGLALLDGRLGNFGGLDALGATVQANAIANRFSAKKSVDEENQNGGNTTYTFNQYNNSPKALSRLDLYRQTKNQFAMLKGVNAK